MSPYLVVFMIPEKITSCMAPCVDIPPLPLNFHAYAYTSAFWASSSESLSFCGTAVGLLTHQ